jgi:hypothetical protein
MQKRADPPGELRPSSQRTPVKAYRGFSAAAAKIERRIISRSKPAGSSVAFWLVAYRRRQTASAAINTDTNVRQAQVLDAPLSPGNPVSPGTPQTFTGVGGTSTSGGALTALQSFEAAIGGANNGANAPAVPDHWPDGLSWSTGEAGFPAWAWAPAIIRLPGDHLPELPRKELDRVSD